MLNGLFILQFYCQLLIFTVQFSCFEVGIYWTRCNKTTYTEFIYIYFKCQDIKCRAQFKPCYYFFLFILLFIIYIKNDAILNIFEKPMT